MVRASNFGPGPEAADLNEPISDKKTAAKTEGGDNKGRARRPAKEKITAYDVFIGGMSVAVLGGMVAAMVLRTNSGVTPQSLSPMLKPEGHVSPDRLAEEIAKDPEAKARFNEMRTFVDKLNERVEAQSRAGFNKGG